MTINMIIASHYGIIWHFSLCSVSDGLDTIYVIAGCKDCWLDGFIEKYQVSTGVWTKIDAVPNVDIYNKDDLYAEVCAYSNGYIYTIFFRDNPSVGPRYIMDKRFHIYNTVQNTWSISDTQIKREAFFTVSGVIPKWISMRQHLVYLSHYGHFYFETYHLSLQNAALFAFHA